MLFKAKSINLLRPGSIIAIALVMLASFYLFSKFQQCCGGELHLLSCSLRGIEKQWIPSRRNVTDACYHSNLLTRLESIMTAQLEVRSLHLPFRPGFYATLKQPVELANLTSEACANALASIDSPAMVVEKFNESNCFKRFLTPSAEAESYRQLRYLLSEFSRRGLEIFLLDGSLIGSVRHFGLIPWDDDLDFGIRSDQRSEVRRLLEELTAGDSPYLFLDTEALNLHWKFGIMCVVVDHKRRTKSCHLSIDFFLIRTSGRWFIRPEWPNVFPIEDIYPLSWRPFGPGLLLPSPRRPLHFLMRQYRSEVMQRCHYQPHTSTGCRQPSISCQAMRHQGRHPFVEFVRLPAPSGWSTETRKNITVELLLWQRKLISVFIPIEN